VCDDCGEISPGYKLNEREVKKSGVN